MKDEEMAEEQKLCLKAQSFKEDVKAHNIDVINAVENKLDAYKVGRYDGYIDGYHEGFKDCAKSRLNVTTISDCPIKDEWHYVKDEKDLPTDKKEYLLLLGSNIRTFGFYNGRFWESWKGDFSWQEVKAYFSVPVPELPKEIE